MVRVSIFDLPCASLAVHDPVSARARARVRSESVSHARAHLQAAIRELHVPGIFKRDLLQDCEMPPPSTPPVFGLRHLGSSAAADSADPGGGGSGGADLGIATAPYAPSAGDLPNTLHRDRFPALSVEPAGTRQGLHVTAFEMSRWLLLLAGRKRVRIFHRDDTPLLYPRYELSLDPTFQVDPEMNEVEPQGLLKVASSATNLKQRAGASSGAVSFEDLASLDDAEAQAASEAADALGAKPAAATHAAGGDSLSPAAMPKIARESSGLRPRNWRYPTLCAARGWETELRAGELLYVPAGCAYAVHNLEDAVSLSANFVDEPAVERVAARLRADSILDPRLTNMADALEHAAAAAAAGTDAPIGTEGGESLFVRWRAGDASGHAEAASSRKRRRTETSDFSKAQPMK